MPLVCQLEVVELIVHTHLHLSQLLFLPRSHSKEVVAVLRSAESTCWRHLGELSTKWIGFASWLGFWEVQIRWTAEINFCPDNWSFQVVFSLQSYCVVSTSEWWLQLWLGLVSQKSRYDHTTSTSVVWRQACTCSVWSFTPCISVAMQSDFYHGLPRLPQGFSPFQLLTGHQL